MQLYFPQYTININVLKMGGYYLHDYLYYLLTTEHCALIKTILLSKNMTCLPKYRACLELFGQIKCYNYEYLTSFYPIFYTNDKQQFLKHF